MVNFPTWIPDCDSHGPALQDFFLLMLAFVLQWLSLYWEILIMLLSQFPLTFHHIHNRMPYLIALLMTVVVLIGMVFGIIWEDIFKPSAFAAANEFCEWDQVWIDLYIPHRKYQVKPHWSTLFSATCAAAIVHRSHFFRLYQKDKSSDSKGKFRQAINCCKRVLELPHLHMLITQKSPSLPRNLALGAFGKLPIVFSTKLL